MACSHNVIPGGLGEAEHAAIFALADKGWSASRIARKIEKHPSTVGWFMYCQGLRPPKQKAEAAPYQRAGRLVRPFSKAEDDVIQPLRAQGLTFRQIGERHADYFGFKRHPTCIRNRLIMLAGLEEDA